MLCLGGALLSLSQAVAVPHDCESSGMVLCCKEWQSKSKILQIGSVSSNYMFTVFVYVSVTELYHMLALFVSISPYPYLL